eukprot:TRINITY_DN44692_c0_g1_i2.p1 TRINITY_DN44692_c0_g1~~TRINITY_DN44692_c0_g1_i2.p1  ORF type:complete len:512 (-),score=89.74 TRINITY_DN44692_c0_g1_i2:3-1538(-)
MKVHVVEAQAHVGGRVRNFDIAKKQFDVDSDDVVEVGGTFVSPSHTALRAFAERQAVEVYNATSFGGVRLKGNLARLAQGRLKEPQDEWPWWYWGATTDMNEASAIRTSLGVYKFRTPAELLGSLPPAVVAELNATGTAILDAAQQVPCESPHTTGADGDGGRWYEYDSVTTDGWLRQRMHNEEALSMLRAMMRGMIAQEPSVVSFLSTLKSLKGCWSGGDDDVYRMRGGTQAPLLRAATKLNVTLSSPVRRIERLHAVGSKGVFQVTSEKAVIRASYVVVTGPPPALQAISFEPPLSANHAQLLQRMPMGTSLKYFLAYDKNWWKDLGSNGQVLSTLPTPLGDLFDACQDHSPFSHVRPVLMCWIEGETNLRFMQLSPQEQEEHVVQFLAAGLNTSAALGPRQVTAFNWADVPYARGAYTGYFAPGCQSQPEMWAAYTDDEWIKPGLWIAGSDWHPGFGNGYMEGAVRSGEAAAARILRERRGDAAAVASAEVVRSSEASLEPEMHSVLV